MTLARWWIAAVVLAACGGSKEQPKEAGPGDDAAAEAGVDAPFEPPACAHASAGSTISYREIGRVSITGAVLATSPPGDPRLFVVEQIGGIRLFKDEVLQPTPFIDLSQDAGGPVIGGDGGGDEKGLLGLAFHPNYAANRLFYLFYTSTRSGAFHNFLVRCEASVANPDVANPSSCVEMLAFRDPYSNHQGGMLAFGPDGFLYLGLGDGGGGGDPFGYAQDLTSLLGKMLRIDVDHKDPGKEYGIPTDNPYATGGGLPEIYMRGLRNPWRWTFDRVTGDMWIADVGQQIVEEVNVLRPSEQRNANLGWSIFEGDQCCVTTPYRCQVSAPADQCPPPAGFVFPKDNRRREIGDLGWQAIIGGEVYRGSCFPDLVGWYLYSDWNQMDLAKARLKSDGTLEIVDLPGKLPGHPASIHGDSRGELYLTTSEGYVYRIEARP
ncbi:MAG: h16 [Myxococcales bacterium]|nr:h16 [Myxococcales bacterium]